MGAIKVVKNNGFLALFYQANWDKVNKTLYEFVIDVFEGKTSVEKVNQTLIILIPKQDHLKFIN